MEEQADSSDSDWQIELASEESNEEEESESWPSPLNRPRRPYDMQDRHQYIMDMMHSTVKSVVMPASDDIFECPVLLTGTTGFLIGDELPLQSSLHNERYRIRHAAMGTQGLLVTITQEEDDLLDEAQLLGNIRDARKQGTDLPHLCMLHKVIRSGDNPHGDGSPLILIKCVGRVRIVDFTVGTDGIVFVTAVLRSEKMLQSAEMALLGPEAAAFPQRMKDRMVEGMGSVGGAMQRNSTRRTVEELARRLSRRIPREKVQRAIEGGVESFAYFALRNTLYDIRSKLELASIGCVDHQLAALRALPEELSASCHSCGATLFSSADTLHLDPLNSCYGLYINPHDFVFDVVLTVTRPETTSTSEYMANFCWFPGYSWTYLTCSNCDVHLGWQYRSAIFAPEYFCAFVRSNVIMNVSRTIFRDHDLPYLPALEEA